jgi:hypothetical protein
VCTPRRKYDPVQQSSLLLEPAAASTTHRAVDDAAEHGTADCATDSSAAGERADYRNPVVDCGVNSAAATVSARIALVSVHDSTAKNNSDDRSDSAADIAAASADLPVTCSAAVRCDWLGTLARKRRHFSRLRLDLRRHLGLLYLDRSWKRLRRSLVLWSTLRLRDPPGRRSRAFDRGNDLGGRL